MESQQDKVGIVLAGGTGSRLFPLTYGVSKQLLPVYKQPMIYYPLKTLKDMGIREVLIIVASDLQKELFFRYLGNGSQFDMKFEYVIQLKPNGLAEAFIIGEKFINGRDVVLILGDNVLLQDGGKNELMNIKPNTIFTYKVSNPSAYGVARFTDNGELLEIVEKPQEFISNYAVIGLYCFTSDACDLAKQLKPSKRGELEIVDLISLINEKYGVTVKESPGIWFDCGTHDDLLECAELVRALDKRTTYDILLKE